MSTQTSSIFNFTFSVLQTLRNNFSIQNIFSTPMKNSQCVKIFPLPLRRKKFLFFISRCFFLHPLNLFSIYTNTFAWDRIFFGFIFQFNSSSNVLFLFFVCLLLLCVSFKLSCTHNFFSVVPFFVLLCEEKENVFFFSIKLNA